MSTRLAYFQQRRPLPQQVNCLSPKLYSVVAQWAGLLRVDPRPNRLCHMFGSQHSSRNADRPSMRALNDLKTVQKMYIHDGNYSVIDGGIPGERTRG